METPDPAGELTTAKIGVLLAHFAPTRCWNQPQKGPVVQSHGIALSFHCEMADAPREFVGPDVAAAVTFESYPRFIKGGFQDYERLGIKRPTANSNHVPLTTIEVARKQRLLEHSPGNESNFWSQLEFFARTHLNGGACVSRPRR
jgi:hypothetical protein